MRRFLFAALASLSLVTAAVTVVAGEKWYLSVTIPEVQETSVYGNSPSDPVPFASRQACVEVFLELRDEFEDAEHIEHGPDITFVWKCETPGHGI